MNIIFLRMFLLLILDFYYLNQKISFLMDRLSIDRNLKLMKRILIFENL